MFAINVFIEVGHRFLLRAPWEIYVKSSGSLGIGY
jgi:hypothetical protein